MNCWSPPEMWGLSLAQQVSPVGAEDSQVAPHEDRGSETPNLSSSSVQAQAARPRFQAGCWKCLL